MKELIDMPLWLKRIDGHKGHPGNMNDLEKLSLEIYILREMILRNQDNPGHAPDPKTT